MGQRIRRLGVYGDNLPTRKTVTVQASDFLIGGIIGQFERKYAVAMLCNSPTEFAEKFGENVDSTFYGYDAVKGFFDNLRGAFGKLYVKSYVGCSASTGAIDAVTATVNLLDASIPTCRLDAAYQTNLEYGVSGNRTGYTVTNGARFSTTGVVGTAPDTFAVMASVAGVKVGDIMKFSLTGGGAATVFKKILTVDTSANKVTFSGVMHATSNLANGDVCIVCGFKINTYRKSINGIVSEVDVELGKVWCTMEAEVSDFYVNNVFANSKWIKATDLASATALGTGTIPGSFPVNVATVTYLTTGADGTVPSTSVSWAASLTSFTPYSVRFIANCETTDTTIQKAIETYCAARTDKPKVIYNVASNQTKAQLIVIGNNYQRSDDVLGVICSDWIKVADPFATSTLAPYRSVPNVGHVMGAWVRSIATLGIHYIPSVKSISLIGVMGMTGYGSTFSDDDRTDIAEAGVNIIQNITGSGYVIRNFFTPSTTLEFMFANGILMREYIKVSVVDSLQSTENEPNNYDRIKQSRMAILQFLYNLWNVGSTGTVPTGETFGQSFDSQGNPTVAEDHFFVQADPINNPQSSINAGNRNLDSWITFPSPAGSIKVGVGLWLR
jgi:hypothetical protein